MFEEVSRFNKKLFAELSNFRLYFANGFLDAFEFKISFFRRIHLLFLVKRFIQSPPLLPLHLDQILKGAIEVILFFISEVSSAELGSKQDDNHLHSLTQVWPLFAINCQLTHVIKVYPLLAS